MLIHHVKLMKIIKKTKKYYIIISDYIIFHYSKNLSIIIYCTLMNYYIYLIIINILHVYPFF